MTKTGRSGFPTAESGRTKRAPASLETPMTKRGKSREGTVSRIGLVSRDDYWAGVPATGLLRKLQIAFEPF